MFLEITIHSDLILLKNNLENYFDYKKYEPTITTKNDFMRHCPNINEGGHKMSQPPKIPDDFLRRSFYLRRRSQLPTS
jgi:hypothetical protein